MQTTNNQPSYQSIVEQFVTFGLELMSREEMRAHFEEGLGEAGFLSRLVFRGARKTAFINFMLERWPSSAALQVRGYIKGLPEDTFLAFCDENELEPDLEAFKVMFGYCYENVPEVYQQTLVDVQVAMGPWFDRTSAEFVAAQ